MDDMTYLLEKENIIKEEGRGIVNAIKNAMDSRTKCGVNTKEFTLKMNKTTIQKLLKYIEVLEIDSKFSIFNKKEEI